MFKRRYNFWFNYRRIKFIIKELKRDSNVMNDILISDKRSRKFIKNIYGLKKVKQMKLQVIQDCKKIEKDFEQIYKILGELNNMSLDEK